MKKIFTTLLLLLAGTAAIFSQQLPELLYYKFDGTGTTVPNQALTPPPGTNTATIMGGLTQGQTGQCGGALVGSGVSSSTDYLNTGWATSLSGSWTISMYTRDITSSSTLFYIFGDANAGSFRCFTNGVAGPNNWILRGGFTDVLVSGGATVAPHVTTFVYDAVAGNIKGYLDGVLVTTVAQSPITISGTGPFKVMGYATNVGAPAGGKLDEFRIYNRALTAAEVATLLAPASFSTFSVVSCGPYTVPSGDETYSISGTYQDTIPSMGGCDSIMTITVNVANNTSSYAVNACASYTVPSGDETYTASGTYMDTIPNMYGCDSVMTITVSINNTSSTFSASGCASYTVPSGNATYTTSGTYTDVIPNAAGCDSIMTIMVSINNTTSAFSASGCASYTAPSGATYTTNGTYTDVIPNAAGCDSIMTITVSINNSTSSFTATGCGSYTVPSGNETYTMAGTYMDTIPNALGCDSIMMITVMLNNSADTFSVTNCVSYTVPSGTMTYTTSGTYTDTIPNAMGCDSILTINVTINTPPAVIASAAANTVCIDDAVVALTGSPAGGTWGGMGVVGPTFTPSTAGIGIWTVTYSYTDANGCENSSSTAITVNTCVSVEEQTLANGISIYPNPNNGVFTLAVDANLGDMQIVITDLQGRVVYSSNENNSSAGYTQQINLQNEAAGMYLLQITANGQQRTDKISVQK